MRAVLTRVTEASIEIDGKIYSEIKMGYLVLLGVFESDTPEDVEQLADKITKLRVFSDENGKMNLNLETVGGSILIVSQFTLCADLSSRRPGFTKAARPDFAVSLYKFFCEKCEAAGFEVKTGCFGANMKVKSINDGPVTIIFDTQNGG